MQTRKIIIPALIIFAGITACIDEYWPDDITKYEDLLVVDGYISNEPGPYTIKLSISAGINDPRYLPLSGAEVRITDEDGNSELLTETADGTYETAEDRIQGEAGTGYKLTIIRPDERVYESGFQMLRHPLAIDSLYAKLEYHSSEEHAYDLAGYQFYITTERAEHDSSYLFWDLIETYQYNADFTIEYLYDGGYTRFPKPDSLFTCWRNASIEEMFLYSTENLSPPQIRNYPINYVSTQTKRLSIRYSLLARQLSISGEAYDYWNNIREIIDNQGSLYNSQPFQIRGNIKNINDENEPVLGFFMVAGVDSKRIFVDRPDGVDFHYGECYADTDPRYLEAIPPGLWPVYVTTTESGRYAYGAETCFDCRLVGGTIYKPDFWIDGN